MKKSKKILSAAIAAALLLSLLTCLTTFAKTDITGMQLKKLAESKTLDQNPYVNEILNSEYLGEDYPLNISESTKIIGDYIDSSKAYMVINDAFYITQFFMPENGNAKNFEEAIALSKAESESYDYYMPIDKTYDQLGNEYNTYYVQVYVDSESIVHHIHSYLYEEYSLYNFDKEYDKVAELINKNDLGTPLEVYLFNYTNAMGITTEKGSYLITFKEWENEFASYIGKENIRINPYTVYTVSEYNEYYKSYQEDQTAARTAFYEKLRAAAPEYKTIEELLEIENNIKDTDSFSKYIGTAPQYSDIEPNQSAVTNQLTDIGVITGKDGKFYPNDEVTRAEAAAMLSRLFKLELKESNKFPDVTASHWASKYIGALSNEEIINGFEDGTFKPEEKVTYDQIFKMVEYLLGYSDSDTWIYGGYPTGTLVSASKLGLTDDLGSFDSGSNITRIELACVLSRALDTHLVGFNIYIAPFGLNTYDCKDITLSDYISGKETMGLILRSDKAKKEYTDKIENYYIEKCGAVIDEFNEKTKAGQDKGITGGIGATMTASNHIPKITE